MSFLEVSLRFKLNVTGVALTKLSEGSNTLATHVEAISAQEMVLLPLRSNSAGGRQEGAAHY